MDSVKPQVPQLDLILQYQEIRAEIEQAIGRVCEAQKFILGPEVEQFEKEVADYCGVAFAIGVSSGTDALLMALVVAGVGSDDEVITSPFSFFATAGSICRLGAKPVFVDINPQTFNIDPSQIRAKITAKTKAIIPVHLFGQSAQMNEVNKIAQEYGLTVIEDAAQAIGAEYYKKRTGSLGTLGCFSFFPSKNLGGFGDSGLITTNDPKLAKELFALRVHGQTGPYLHTLIGGNFRIDALQAAILRVKLRYLEIWTKRRREIAQIYRALFFEYGLAQKGSQNDSKPLALPYEDPNCGHVYNQFVISCKVRQQLKEFLRSQGVGVQVYYPLPLHLQECLTYLGYKQGDFPLSEQAAAEVLALPIFPELTKEQVCYVVEQCKNFFNSH